MYTEEQLKKVEEKLEKLTVKYNELEERKTVKLYNATKQAIRGLENERKRLEKELRINHFATCYHIWSKLIMNYSLSQSFEHCVKCGLDSRVSIRRGFSLTDDEKLMLETINTRRWWDGIRPRPAADYDLEKAVYDKILEAHPDIDSVTAAKYIGIALENMLDIKENSKREKTIRKSLKLNDNYNYKAAIKDRK